MPSIGATEDFSEEKINDLIRQKEDAIGNYINNEIMSVTDDFSKKIKEVKKLEIDIKNAKLKRENVKKKSDDYQEFTTKIEKLVSERVRAEGRAKELDAARNAMAILGNKSLSISNDDLQTGKGMELAKQAVSYIKNKYHIQ